MSADWSDATLFEVIVYGQDIDLYRKAFVEGDLDALRSEGMVKAFDELRLMVSKYMDPAIAGRDYDSASAMLSNGEAGFFIMGDWEIGTLTAAGVKANEDYLCGQAPTDWGKPGLHPERRTRSCSSSRATPNTSRARRCWRSMILSPDFQTIFNQAKGSIPARLDVDLSQGFNPCQQLSQKDLQGSIAEGTLVRSMAHNMTVLQKYRGAMMEMITEFVNTPDMSSEDAANAMADNVEAQM